MYGYNVVKAMIRIDRLLAFGAGYNREVCGPFFVVDLLKITLILLVLRFVFKYFKQYCIFCCTRDQTDTG